MLHKKNDLDPILFCKQQLPPEPFVILADVITQLRKILLPVNDQPGIIIIHIIPDHQLRHGMFDSFPVKFRDNLFDCPRLFPAVNLYYQNLHS